MATSAERKALNEGKFRDANEQIERAAVEIVGVDDERFVPFLCECPQMECTQIALLTLREYEQVRSGSKQALRYSATRISLLRACLSATSGSF